ncbi:translocation/assembly module TamB [Ursidibacter maritimus]|uniref:Translocation/assembly module TamB n=1 Tax=Ursidibacter maritimus TaxID=1331689 RepID=A0A949T9R7_9PAST|nr:translocation/assembly module TamB domain-containing protein [Ursidibacter maritimus]KAE9538254.1 tubulin-binding protein [Ursidibacter maritimus]MBV6523890.1 translocation/assembly module TamB [Ursidibacter maritimus]MBV6526258.1 translocation/assembly module TamB [Ursidibacter maritimus]MBV6527692.1 translocation/assembly module TamB [Ursidibacter maritimus]MBV6529547.1 translocation/assembly module TamB [Ursidibacter maritimus]
MDEKKLEKPDVAEQTENVEHQPKKRKCRIFAWLFVILFLIIAIPVAFLATGKGQQMALDFVAKQLQGLSFSKVEGSLQEGLRLSDAHYQIDGVDVQLGQADLHIGLNCLLERKACLENLAVKNAVIAIDTSKLPASQPKESEPLGKIELPIPVSLKQMTLDNVQVKVDDMDITLDHFHSGLSGEGSNLTLSPTLVKGLALSLPAQQAVSSEQKNTKKENEPTQPVNWQEIKQKVSQPLLTKLDPIQLPIDLNIPEFKAEDIHIQQKTQDLDGKMQEPTSLVHISEVELVAKSDSSSINLTTLSVKTDKGNISGKGLLTLSENYPLDWQLNANSPVLKEYGLPASQVNATVSGELFGKTELDIQTEGAVNAKINGFVKLAEPKTPLQLQIQSEQVNYPFIQEKGVDPLKLKNVALLLSGDLLDYQLETSLAMSGMKLPAGDLALKGKGGLTEFTLQDLNLNALQGKANLNGKVDWSNGVEWQSKLNVNGINTKALLPEWAAVLSGNLESSGYAARGEKGDEWAVNVSDIDMQGNLFQKNLQLKGELKSDSQTLLNVPNATLVYGENNIALKGILGEKSDFIAEIKAPSLQGLVPNLKASVNGNVKLQGKVTEPELNLDLTANNVSYEQFGLQHLTAKGKITTEKTIQGDVEIGLRGFKQGDIRIDDATLVANGSEANHSLKLTAKGEPVGAALQLTGKFDRSTQQWQGQLANIAIQSPVGEWKNDKALQISYDNRKIQADISAHCWHNAKVNICFPQRFQAGKEGKVPFEIKQFDLATLQEFLEKESQISGIVAAKGDAAWFTNKAPQVNVELTSNAVKFSQKIDYRTFPITLSPVKIVANLSDNNLKLNTDIKIENNGRIYSELLMKDIANARALSGKINIEQLNLSLIKPLLTNGETVTGDINANLTLGGNALSPLLYGNLNLTGLNARSAMMPFDVTGGNLALNFNGASSTLKGNVQTKESNLLLEGDANWKKLDAWHTRVTAKADKFRLDIPSIAKVDVSPNIEVKATPKELVLSGNVDIPWARIEVEELPESAVSVSPDEVIMDGSVRNKLANKVATLPKNVPQTGSGMAMKADITINIGNDVRLDAYGLKTDLYGMLKVRQGSKGLGLYGQVNLKNGTFASFGQDLVVRKGLISFTGLPSQPTLDIEAIRNPEAIEDSSIIAGVKVTGIADSPEVKLFSTPSMSQDQILSYILTGRGLEGSGDAGSGNSIAAALIGMSLSKSSKVVGGVGSAFGISDLNVTTAGIGDNTKVVVSGSLTPKFKVKYGVGIFAPLTELTLRYRLAPSLYLQWVSSVNQAVDLLYRFEFD